LQAYVEKLIDIRNDLAHAIEDAEFLSIDPPISGVEEIHIDEASQAVVLLGSQIEKLENYIQQLQDQPPPAGEGPYDTNPYFINPTQDSKDKKNIKGILKDLTPCDKKDWGLPRRFRYNPRSDYPTFRGRKIRSHRRLRRYRPRFLKNPYRRPHYPW
jgi:hypothetical protein